MCRLYTNHSLPPVRNAIVILHVAMLVMGLWLFGCASRSQAVRPDAATYGKPTDPGRFAIPPASSAYKHYLRGRSLALRKKYNEAIDQMRLALAFDPESARLHYELALLFVGNARYSPAIHELKEAVKLDPKWPDPYYLIGEIAFLQNKLDMARAYFERATLIDSDHRDAIKRLGDVIYLQHGPEGMREYYEGVVARDKTIAFAWASLAKLYHYMQEYGKLEEALKSLLKIDPDNTAAIEQLSSWYARTRRYDEAIRLFRQLRELGPPAAVFPLKLGEFHLRAGRLDQARRYLEEAKAFDIADDRMALAAALVYLQTEYYSEALEELRAINDRGGSGASRYFQGWVLLKQGKLKAALDAYALVKAGDEEYYLNAQIDTATCYWKLGKKRKADRHVENLMALHEKRAEIYRLTAHYFNEIKRMGKAVEALDRGLGQLPDDTSLLYLKGLMLEQDGRKDKALETMDRLLFVDPEHADAINFVGFSLAERNTRLEEAERMIRRAMLLKPGQGYIIDSLGWVLYRRGKIEEAAKWLSMAAMIEPEEAEILLHLAVTYRDMGDRNEEFLQILRRAAGYKIESEELEKKFQAAFPKLWPKLREAVWSGEDMK